MGKYDKRIWPRWATGDRTAGLSWNLKGVFAVEWTTGASWGVKQHMPWPLGRESGILAQESLVWGEAWGRLEARPQWGLVGHRRVVRASTQVDSLRIDCWVLLQHPCPQHPVMDSMPLGHGKWCSAQKRPGMRGSWRATGCRENTYSATPEAAEWFCF